MGNLLDQNWPLISEVLEAARALKCEDIDRGTGDINIGKEVEYLIGVMFSGLKFPGHLFQFSEGKDRAILAHILIPDIASTTDADTTFHAHLKRKYDPLGREPQFL